MSQPDEKKEFWAIVSLMGHQQIAGFLDEYTMGGCSFLRITVPETSRQPSWSRLFKDNSIYSIDPCTEPVAKWKAESLNVAPITVWDANSMLEKQLEKNGKVVVSRDALPEGFLSEPAIAHVDRGDQDDFENEDDKDNY